MDTDPLRRIIIEGYLSPGAIQRIIDAIGPLAMQEGATVRLEQVHPSPEQSSTIDEDETIKPLVDDEGIQLNPAYYEYLPVDLNSKETKPVVSLRIIKEQMTRQSPTNNSSNIEILWTSMTHKRNSDVLQKYIVLHDNPETVDAYEILVGLRPEYLNEFVEKLQAGEIRLPNITPGIIRILASARDKLYFPIGSMGEPED